MRYIPQEEGGAQQLSSNSSPRKNPVKLLTRDVTTHRSSQKKE